jgi:hypothetical protein
MITLTEKEKEVLLETIHTYTSNNRGYDEDKQMCVYETEDGKRCAVGRCMTPNGLAFGKHLVDSGKPSAVASVHERSHSGIDYYLKPEYQGLRIEFWDALQNLHDSICYWDEKGLSNLGINTAERLFNVKFSPVYNSGPCSTFQPDVTAEEHADDIRKFILTNQ